MSTNTNGEMYAKFIEAYSEMPDPKKNAENPAFKRNGKPMGYADLEAFLDVAKPILIACGFALVQQPVSDGDRVGVHTRLLFVTGDEMDFGEFTVALSKPDPQGAGGAITYCRRYAVAAIFGLAQEDDDANGVSRSKPAASAPRPAVAEGATKDDLTRVIEVAKAEGHAPALKAFLTDNGGANARAWAALTTPQRERAAAIACGALPYAKGAAA
jgi:hypothetical protein